MTYEWKTGDGDKRGWVYAAMSNDGRGYVVLNRKGEILHSRATFSEAFDWANTNTELIDKPGPKNSDSPTFSLQPPKRSQRADPTN